MRQLTLAAALAVLIAATADTSAGQPDKKADPKKADPKKADPKAKDEPEPKFILKLKTADITFGNHISGAKLTTAALKGKVVVLDFWGVKCGPCLAAMPATVALHAELADFGLVVIGSHVQAAKPDQIRATAESNGMTFSVSEQTRVTGGNDFTTVPHTMVFDHTGACIFRGDPAEAEVKARVAVGEMLLAAADREKEREKFAPQLASVIADLKKGQPPLSVMPRVAALQNSTNADAKADAKVLLAALTAAGQKKLDLATEKAESEPVEAFLLVEKLPVAYKGTPLAKEAAALVTKLKTDKAVKAELAARPAFEMVRQMDAQLAARVGEEKPNAPEFQKANADLLKQLRAKVAQMKKSWPDAKVTAEAVGVAEKYAP